MTTPDHSPNRDGARLAGRIPAPQLADAGIALLLIAVMCLLLWVDLPDELVQNGEGQPGERRLLPYLVGTAAVLPLAWRRSHPCTVAVLVSTGLLVIRLMEIPEYIISSTAFYVAIYSAGKYGRPGWHHWVRAYGGFVLVVLWAWIWGVFGTLVRGTTGVTFLLVLMVIEVFGFAAIWMIGDLARRNQQRTEELLRRTIELEIERERSAQQAATAERLRIARELHDALGHHVSVMGVQAAGARRVLPAGAERADTALAAIESSARQAVTELQRTLALLRSGDDDGTSPAVTIERIPALVDDVRNAGISVTLQIGSLPDLPPSLELATARVVQEALTNTLRHAGPGASAWVNVTREQDLLRIVVGDDGRGDPISVSDPGRAGSGRGLLGLRERVELHGGRFTAGPHDGGFQIRAELPLPEGTASSPAAVTVDA